MARKKMSPFDITAIVLLIVGGLNWGLVGIFDVNLIQLLFGNVEWLVRVIYGLVGIAAGWSLWTFMKNSL